MKEEEKNLTEEITVFPRQSTFNCDDMRIEEEKEGMKDVLYHAGHQTGSGEPLLHP